MKSQQWRCTVRHIPLVLYTYRTYKSPFSCSAPPPTFLLSTVSNSQHVGKAPMMTFTVPCPVSRAARNEPVQALLMTKPAPLGRNSHYSPNRERCEPRAGMWGDHESRRRSAPSKKGNQKLSPAGSPAHESHALLAPLCSQHLDRVLSPSGRR